MFNNVIAIGRLGLVPIIMAVVGALLYGIYFIYDNEIIAEIGLGLMFISVLVTALIISCRLALLLWNLLHK